MFPLDALARSIVAVGTAPRPLPHQHAGPPYAKVGGEIAIVILVKAALEKSTCKSNHDARMVDA